ncbi:molybdopterin-dependent oxidoreductase [Undibacterium sp. Ren11W]|uniref:molybdopterin-dependent oxidoreductase n=1 Tax=Undibacterium sp. Ren11W TaxID=3413045 RepID=UPI003BEFAF8E
MRSVARPLPPGQFELGSFPRFGLLAYAKRWPRLTQAGAIRVYGDGMQPFLLNNSLAALSRVEQRSDFHCVTTWSQTNLAWSGWRFSDFYQKLVLPNCVAEANTKFVVMYGMDGYRSILPLADLLACDVLLADRLQGEPLAIEHGAPLRLVAPAHYGYKSVKHLCAIEFLDSAEAFRPVGMRFMAHPRARVQSEERGVGLSGRVLRWLYRPLVGLVIARFARASAQHLPHQYADD